MDKKLKQNLINEYKNIFEGIFEAGGGYNFRYFHGLRTMKYCEQFLKLSQFKNKSINKDALIIASLFSDVGKVKAINKSNELVYGSAGDRNHEKIGARIVLNYLLKHINNQKLIKLVAQIISEQKGARQTTIESKLVKDADRLDNYGFIKIWRTITYANYDKRNIDRLKEFWIDEKERNSAKIYLEKFNFPVIKKIAIERFKKFDYLILEIDRESQGKDIT